MIVFQYVSLKAPSAARMHNRPVRKGWDLFTHSRAENIAFSLSNFIEKQGLWLGDAARLCYDGRTLKSTVKVSMSASFSNTVLKAAVSGILLSALAGGAQAADLKSRVTALGLTPHKALYDIKLVATHSGSQILNISGQMFYEWEQTCDAWVSNHRFNMLYEYADSAPMRVSSDFSTYEPFDGLSFNYTSQRKRDGELFEELRGQATVSADGQAGSAIYTLPPELRFDLPAGVLFPMGHSVGVGEKIKAGEKFYKAVIFDGSDDGGPVEVTTFIGKPVEQPKLQKADGAAMIDQKLLNSPAHKVRLAFFPLSTPDSATSDYEMTMNLHDNGVISDMTIEYEDFTVSQKLIALEPMPDACNTKKLNR
jgi:hypothetical protein